MADTEAWPALPLEAWRETRDTVHMWTQVVGKIRLAQSPPVNHWWHTTLYGSAIGLGTGAMPHGERTFEIDFDFIAEQLRITASDGAVRAFDLEGCSVATFHDRTMSALEDLDLPVRIWTQPVEVEDPVRFEDDGRDAWDGESVRCFWRILARSEHVMRRFRDRFVGKASPVHFFWGSFDQALTLFSGRRSPPHPGGVPNLADWVTREAYSHECSSMGFWPGGGAVAAPAFYAYCWPEPEGYREAPVPEPAFFSPDLNEFILPYDDVRGSDDPEDTLLRFFDATYEAAAECGRWDRAALERVREGGA